MIISRDISLAITPAAIKGVNTQQACVLSIGNFDGVHIGHQAMLKKARACANTLKIPLCVLSFDPHPEAFFAPKSQMPRLNSLSERALLFEKEGVDVAYFLPFNANLAAMSDTAFVDDVLVKQLNAKCVVIGDDFHYGKGRNGNVDRLRAEGLKKGFEVIQLNSVCVGSSRVSSTKIRTLLAEGDFINAEAFLGRPYTIMGRVIHGDARGRTWGFPTLNLAMHHRRALKGVFAVSVTGLADKTLYGVANLGKRPTIGGEKTLLEVNVFDYDEDAYGKRVCVRFHQQIRQEEKFDSFDALKAQIEKDKQSAMRFFDSLG